jgi:prepilin-type N-terminal cleavage/methylation domain-containing protein
MSELRAKTRKLDGGFSLVELAVVTAIVGVLASVAVPSFDLMVQRARGAEAKTMLAAIYDSETIFFGEFQAYTARLDAMAFQPSGMLRYNLGFFNDGGPPPPEAPQGTADCYQACPTSHCVNVTWTCDRAALYLVEGNVLQFAGPTDFLAGAHAHWGGEQTQAESYLIDQAKRLVYLPIGVAN